MSLFSVYAGSAASMLQGIPGPTPHIPLGNLEDFANGLPWQACARYGREYGGITLAWAFNQPVLVLNDPKLVAEVLIERTDDFYKDQPVAALTPVTTDNSPFVLNGEAWARAREHSPLSQSWFPVWLEERVATVYPYVRAKAAELEAAGTVDAYKTMERFTFDVFSRATLGMELGDDAYADFMEMACVGNIRIKSALPVLPPPITPDFYKARDRWYDLFKDLVQEKWNNKDSNATDLVSTVARQGTTLSLDLLSIAVANIYFGGAFSAASGVVNTLYQLARNPEISSRLQTEISTGDNLDADSLEGMTYLDYCLRESLRILPPVPFFSRNSRKDQTIKFAGHTIPKNTEIFLSNWYLHHDPEHWSNPDDYNPSRWADGVAEANPIGSGYFYPFGRGPRMCLGMPFAMTQMKTMLAGILKEARFELEPTQEYCQGFFFGVMVPEKMMGRFVRQVMI